MSLEKNYVIRKNNPSIFFTFGVSFTFLAKFVLPISLLTLYSNNSAQVI